jgi:hypothetical protein
MYAAKAARITTGTLDAMCHKIYSKIGKIDLTNRIDYDNIKEI